MGVDRRIEMQLAEQPAMTTDAASVRSEHNPAGKSGARTIDKIYEAIASGLLFNAGGLVEACGCNSTSDLLPHVSTIALRVVEHVIRTLLLRGTDEFFECDRGTCVEGVYVVKQLCRAVPPDSWPSVRVDCEILGNISLAIKSAGILVLKKEINARIVAESIKGAFGMKSPLLPACMISMFPKGEGSMFLSGYLPNYTSDDAESTLKKSLWYSSILSMYAAIFPSKSKRDLGDLEPGDQLLTPFLRGCLGQLFPHKLQRGIQEPCLSVWEDIVEDGGCLRVECSDGTFHVDPCVARGASSYMKMILPHLTRNRAPDPDDQGLALKQLSRYHRASVELFLRIRVTGRRQALTWLSEKAKLPTTNCESGATDATVCKMECMRILDEMCPGDNAARLASREIACSVDLDGATAEAVAMAIGTACTFECNGLMRVCYDHVSATKGLEDALSGPAREEFQIIRERVQGEIALEQGSPKRHKA